MSTDIQQLVARLDEKYNDGDFDKGDAYDIASAWPTIHAFIERNLCECGHEAAEHLSPYYGCIRVTEIRPASEGGLLRCACDDFRPLADAEASVPAAPVASEGQEETTCGIKDEYGVCGHPLPCVFGAHRMERKAAQPEGE